MQPVFPNNTRYILELERAELLHNRTEFDNTYRQFSLAFLTSFQSFALIAYLAIVVILSCYKNARTKTNFIISIWAAVNFIVIAEQLLNTFTQLILEESDSSFKDLNNLAQILAGLGRFYGASLAIIWLYTKFQKAPHSKYNCFMYSLIFLPIVATFFAIFVYFNLYEYIFEVFGPGCDVINVAIYVSVFLLSVICRIFGEARDNSAYCLILSVVNLITNLPLGLMTVYLKFVLDIGWVTRFHLYFADFAINILTCSNAFLVLFVVILFNRDVRYTILRRRKQFIDV